MTRMRRLGVLLCALLMFTAATGSALAEDGHGDDHDGDTTTTRGRRRRTSPKPSSACITGGRRTCEPT